MSDLLAIQNLVVEYPVGGGRHVHAVSDVTLSVKQGETLGLVGESGSGKSSLARALVLEPSLIVCDEPVSALDVSIRAQIVNLLEDMKARFGLTLLFIAHDLAVVKSVSDRVAVMYLGRLCEVADSDSLFATPAHPYTAALMAAIPVPDPDVPLGDTKLRPGDPPSPLDPPSGCRFRTRCPHAQPRCTDEVPLLRRIAAGREVACHFPLVG